MPKPTRAAFRPFATTARFRKAERSPGSLAWNRGGLDGSGGTLAPASAASPGIDGPPASSLRSSSSVAVQERVE